MRVALGTSASCDRPVFEQEREGLKQAHNSGLRHKSRTTVPRPTLFLITLLAHATPNLLIVVLFDGCDHVDTHRYSGGPLLRSKEASLRDLSDDIVVRWMNGHRRPAAVCCLERRAVQGLLKLRRPEE